MWRADPVAAIGGRHPVAGRVDGAAVRQSVTLADYSISALAGLRASQTNLSLPGRNITNVNTPGYSGTAVRTRVSQASAV